MHIFHSISSHPKIRNSFSSVLICVDTEALRLVVEFSALNEVYGKTLPQLRPSKNNFRFETQLKPPIGAVCLFLDPPTFIPVLPLKADVVSVGVPPLLDLDIHDQQLLAANIVIEILLKRRILRNSKTHKYFDNDKRWIQMYRMDGHVYVKMACVVSTNVFDLINKSFISNISIHELTNSLASFVVHSFTRPLFRQKILWKI